MSTPAQSHLLELYQEWRKHTETERDAISEGDWRRVKACQKAKGELQPRILKKTEEAHVEWLRLGIDRRAGELVVNVNLGLGACALGVLAGTRRAVSI